MQRLLSFLTVLVLWPFPAGAFLADYASHDVPAVARPTLDTPLVDPVFGSTAIRRTDPGQSTGSSGLVHEYSKYSPVNANNTLVAVQVIGGESRGAWRIQDLATHTWRATLPTQGDPEISWHPTDPNLLLYRKGNRLLRYHVDTGTADTLLLALAYTSIGTNEEGRPSFDWRYWAGIGVKSTGQRDIFVADLQSGSILATLANVGSAIDWVTMSPSGQWVVIQYTDGKGTRVSSRSLTLDRSLVADFTHADLALDKEGKDILVYIAVTGAQVTQLGCPNAPNGSPIASARLEDGHRQILLGDCYTADWQPVIAGTFLPWGGAYHFSGIISRVRPGWVFVSSYSASQVPQAPFQRELFLLATDGSGKVERYAHHHSLTDGDYFAEPHATVSWDGSRLFFASTWGQAGRYDFYELPLTVVPPSPPLPDSGPFTCTWLWNREANGTLSGFSAQCVR